MVIFAIAMKISPSYTLDSGLVQYIEEEVIPQYAAYMKDLIMYGYLISGRVTSQGFSRMIRVTTSGMSIVESPSKK